MCYSAICFVHLSDSIPLEGAHDSPRETRGMVISGGGDRRWLLISGDGRFGGRGIATGVDCILMMTCEISGVSQCSGGCVNETRLRQIRCGVVCCRCVNETNTKFRIAHAEV